MIFWNIFYRAESPGCYLPDSRPNSPKIRCFFWGPTAKALLMFGYTSCSSSFVKPRTDIWGASWQCGIICIICLPCIVNDISYTNVWFIDVWYLCWTSHATLIAWLELSWWSIMTTNCIKLKTEDNSCYMQLRVCLILDWICGLHACPLLHDLVAFFLCLFWTAGRCTHGGSPTPPGRVHNAIEGLSVTTYGHSETFARSSYEFILGAKRAAIKCEIKHEYIYIYAQRGAIFFPTTCTSVLRVSLRPHSFAQQVFEITSYKEWNTIHHPQKGFRPGPGKFRNRWQALNF